MTVQTNYFVCTLGEAASDSHNRPYRNVNDLLNQQAHIHPDLPAIGFCKVNRSSSNERFNHEILTFKQVQHGTLVVAELLSNTLQIKPGRTVGLLSSSSPEFLFTWLACLQLSLTVLLIAPECSPTGIAHLCRSSNVELLFADDKHFQLGQKATSAVIDDADSKINCVPLPFEGKDVFDVIKGEHNAHPAEAEEQDLNIAYLHHTSGTSSGLPKPIPQTHRGAVGVLPALDGIGDATFTTTPLYHGGPADIFRAWTSNAMIWLYPSKDIPVTPSNVVKCLNTAQLATEIKPCPPVSYFATVPYILSMLLQDEPAITVLQSMKAVSIGGAALPKDIGDQAVDRDINLVSRFGSAECGFLMSSHRDYARDKEWQYLRQPEDVLSIRFEAQESGLSELIVLSNWPHLAKRNREDGSFATADLFEHHPTIPNAWRYHSRADSQLTLMTGKKFDPAPVEDAIVAASPMISNALIFGNGKPYPGVLLFRSEKGKDHNDDEITEAMVPVMTKIGQDSQAHTRISRDMLVPMPFTIDAIEKSSKGTVLRGRAEERYAFDIEAAYNKRDNEKWKDISDEEIEDAIKSMVVSAMSHKPEDLTGSTDLFSIGVDSIAGIQIRRGLQQLLTSGRDSLSPTIVEECGCIDELTSEILRLRHGGSRTKSASLTNDRQLMLELVKRYSNFHNPCPGNRMNGVNGTHDKPHVVLLTGATGSLGAHVLSILCSNTNVKRIYCLVRGADDTAAKERIDKALQQRHLPTIANVEKVEVVRAALGHEKLELHDDQYSKLARETTVVMHLAWSVNFRMRLSSFERDNIAGVHNLLQFALASPNASSPRFVFCSSVASAMAYPGASVPEQLLDDPSSATNIGYSQSKWVAEHICRHAHDQTRLHGRLSVFRVGQLSGDTKHGVWNAKEAWPLMLGSVKLTKTLPRLDSEFIDWLPVDTAAAATVEGALLLPSTSRHSDDKMPIYHVLNDNTQPSWHDLLGWMHKHLKFEDCTPSQWIAQLDELARQKSDHPALQLLEHWRSAYSTSSDSPPTTDRKRFDMMRSKEMLPSLRHVKPVDEQYFEILWRWIDSAVL